MNYDNDLDKKVLLQKIEILREKLHEKGNNFSNKELLELSQKLDELIVLAMEKDNKEE